MEAMKLKDIPLGENFRYDKAGDFIFQIVSKQPLKFQPAPGQCEAPEKWTFNVDSEEAEHQVFTVIKSTWCECENGFENADYFEENEHPLCKKHCWGCKVCGKIIQVG